MEWLQSVGSIKSCVFCRISSVLQGSFAKEPYNFIDLPNQRHPIAILLRSRDCARYVKSPLCLLSMSVFVLTHQHATELTTHHVPSVLRLRKVEFVAPTAIKGSKNEKKSKKHVDENEDVEEDAREKRTNVAGGEDGVKALEALVHVCQVVGSILGCARAKALGPDSGALQLLCLRTSSQVYTRVGARYIYTQYIYICMHICIFVRVFICMYVYSAGLSVVYFADRLCMCARVHMTGGRTIADELRQEPQQQGPEQQHATLVRVRRRVAADVACSTLGPRHEFPSICHRNTRGRAVESHGDMALALDTAREICRASAGLRARRG